MYKVQRGYRELWLLDWVMWVRQLMAGTVTDELMQLLEVGGGCELVAGLRRPGERYGIRAMRYLEGDVWVEWEEAGPNETGVSSFRELAELVARFPASGWQLKWEDVDQRVPCMGYEFGGEFVGMGIGCERDGVYLSGEAVRQELGVDAKVWERSGWRGVRVAHRWELVKVKATGASEGVLWVHWDCGSGFFGKNVVVREEDTRQSIGELGAIVLRRCLASAWGVLSEGLDRLDQIDLALRAIGRCLYGVEVSDDTGNRRLSVWNDRRRNVESIYSEVVIGRLGGAKGKLVSSGFYSEDLVRVGGGLGSSVFRSVKSWRDATGIDHVVRGLEGDLWELQLQALSC